MAQRLPSAAVSNIPCESEPEARDKAVNGSPLARQIGLGMVRSSDFAATPACGKTIGSKSRFDTSAECIKNKNGSDLTQSNRIIPCTKMREIVLYSEHIAAYGWLLRE